MLRHSLAPRSEDGSVLAQLTTDMGASSLRSQAGFSLIELIMVSVVLATLAGMAVPLYRDLAENSRLNSDVRNVERELQAARLKAVTVNRSLRVALNCPVAGEYRMVEVLGTAADTDATRCRETTYPYPPPDQNPFTRPNNDGPLRRLNPNTTVTTQVVEFRSTGQAFEVVSGVAQPMLADVAITLTRGTNTRTVTINAVGRVRTQ